MVKLHTFGEFAGPFTRTFPSHVFRQPDHRSAGPFARPCHAGRADSPGRTCRADRFGKLRQPRGAGSAGFGAHQQIRRGLPGQALLRRLRVRRPGRGTGHRARQGCVQGRLRQRAAAQRLAGQRRGVFRGPAAGRYDSRHVAGAWRASDPWLAGQLQRQVLQGRELRPDRRNRRDRLRRRRASGEGAQAEDDRHRRFGLFAGHRLEALPCHRRFGRRRADGRHRALRGADRRGLLPQRSALPTTSRPPPTRPCAARAAA